MEKNYPEYRKHLNRLAKALSEKIPGVMSGFGKLHKEALSEGVAIHGQ